MPDIGAIACGHPVTAAAAEEILLDGGNAFDAVIAAQLTACVAEPVLASLGGGGFLLAQPAAGPATVYDFFVQTPLVKRAAGEVDFYPIHADFGTTTQEFHIGLGAVATPGMVAGMFEFHRTLATLPMARLAAPAVRAAREGVEVNVLQASIFEIVRPIYRATAEARDGYDPVHERGLLVQANLGDTIEALAREGSELFYPGEVGARLSRLCAEHGGHLTANDLLSFEVIRRSPLEISYRNAQVVTTPSSGGYLVAWALALLSALDVATTGFGTRAHIEALVETLHASNQARLDVLVKAERISGLDPALLSRYRSQILDQPRFNRGTTHISIADRHGNLAAMSLSNGEGCGSVIPGTGIMLNNMLGEEDINPDGFGHWEPGKRMTSMMAPTLLAPAADWRLALGSGGSNRIRSAILQVISNLVDFNDDPATAVSRPRLHFEREVLSVEGGFAPADLAALEPLVDELHRWPGTNLFFGGVHVVEHRADAFTAAGDSRRGGVGRVVRAG